MSSASCFNLDQSKILSSGNGLRFTHKETVRIFEYQTDRKSDRQTDTNGQK